MKTDMHTVFFILGKIRQQKPKTRARWKSRRNDNEARRQAKRIVIRQWIDEAGNPS